MKIFRSNFAPDLSPDRTDGARNQRGITGLETAIVLIAFVIVTSVFAFTILSAGVFSSEANKQTIHADLPDRAAPARFSLRIRGLREHHAGRVQDRLHRLELTRR